MVRRCEDGTSAQPDFWSEFRMDFRIPCFSPSAFFSAPIFLRTRYGNVNQGFCGERERDRFAFRCFNGDSAQDWLLWPAEEYAATTLLLHF